MITSAPRPLPRLRTGLTISGSSDALLAYDAFAHRYFRLDAVSAAVLTSLANVVGNGDWRTAIAEVATETSGFQVSPASVDAVLMAAEHNGFLEPAPRDAEPTKPGAAKWLLHNYLMMRLPLVRPEPFLDRLRPTLDRLMTRSTATVLGGLLLIALYLASRQTAELSRAFADLASAYQLAGLALTLLVLKVFHELGHGYMARHYGCRVPSSGIMLILGAPLFYTEVSDAWRLPERHKRIWIAAAGILVESAMAILALLLWVFLPDGVARSIAFFVAIGSLATTLFINLSPFMRFDGYFIVSDAVGIANLHDKSFAALKHVIRKALLGFRDPLPQALAGLPLGRMALFGAATATYRFLLFLGLALIVYAFFFKLLGLFLMAVEIAWFILRPIWAELKIWFARRKDIAWLGRGGMALAATLGAIILLAVPLSRSVQVKAVLEPRDSVRIHVQTVSDLVSLHVQNGQPVARGDLLAVLDSPALKAERLVADKRLRLVQLRQSRAAADREMRSQLSVLAEEEQSLQARIAGIDAQLDALNLRAPMDGVIVDLSRDLVAGITVAPRDRLMRIAAPDGTDARAFGSSEKLARIPEAADAVFIPEDPASGRQRFRLVRLASAPATVIDPAALAVPFGGDTPAVTDKQGRAVSSAEAFQILLTADQPPPPVTIRGTMHIAATPESYAARGLRRALSILIRESGA